MHNNHIIPQCQIKFFADENMHVRSFDINNQCYQHTKFKSLDMPISKAASIYNYWENQKVNSEKMEEYLSKFESKFEKVANEIVNGNNDCSSEQDQKIIADWIISRLIFNDLMIGRIKKQTIDFVNDHHSKLIDKLIDSGLSDDNVLNYYDNINHIDFPTPYDIIMNASYNHNVQMAYRMPIWDVIKISQNKFITSDKSVADLIADHNKDDCDYFIPLSPKVCIRISNYKLPFDVKVLFDKNDCLVNRINSNLRDSFYFWIHNKNYDVKQTKENEFLQKFFKKLTIMSLSGAPLKSIKKSVIEELEKSNLKEEDISTIISFLNEIN